MLKVGFLGPIGTHSEKAARQYSDQEESQLMPFRSISQIFEELKLGRVDLGIVPIENSIEGSVNQTLDLLAQEHGISIQGEMVISIRHALMTRKEVLLKNIKKVVSHGQALAQCRKFVEKELPDAIPVEAVSTSEAAKAVAESNEPIAAIGDSQLARIYGLNILKTNITNCAYNKTRFIVIGKQSKVISNATKTSILLSITDRPGGLYQILKEFALKNINLTKIESRPAKNRLGNYLFFIDFLGSINDKSVTDCLKKIKEITADFKVLGSYPGVEEQPSNYEKKLSLSLDEIRQDIDIIDRQIIELLAKRTELVTLVGQYKQPTSIRDKNREEDIIQRLTYEADKKGVDPELIEQLYSIMFEYFVGLQEAQRKKKIAIRHLSKKIKVKS